jgi:hypothetical protein
LLVLHPEGIGIDSDEFKIPIVFLFAPIITIIATSPGLILAFL